MFDDATAMTKFQEWHTDHEANISRRNDEHKSKQRAKKVYVPIVKKVEVKEEVVVAEVAPEAATDTTAEA